jgi:hypothetical protein
MFDESDRHEDQAEAEERQSPAGDGGVPLDAFWARLDPVDA